MSDPSAWCLPDMQSGSPNLEVDFGEDVLVCAIETRGYDSNGDELYAHEFELSFSADGSSFTKYTENSLTRVRTHHASINYIDLINKRIFSSSFIGVQRIVRASEIWLNGSTLARKLSLRTGCS